MYRISLLILLAFFIVLLSCSDNEPDGPMMDECASTNASFENDVAPIINASCALSGCHVSGFASGDFTSYSGVKDRVDSGRFEARAIVAMDMPPSNTPGPMSLSVDQLKVLTCWIAAGAKNN